MSLYYGMGDMQNTFKPLILSASGGGGGGYSPQILVGMCRGKVKNWQGLPVERANGGGGRFEL